MLDVTGKESHHSRSSTRLHAAQPGHVDWRPGAAVRVGRGAVQSGEVVTSMDHQKIIVPVKQRWSCHQRNGTEHIHNPPDTSVISPFDLHLCLIVDPRQDLSGKDGGDVQLLDLLSGGDH